MADGTNIHEPVNGSLVETPIDTFEVSFNGVIRDRQRVALAGKTAASDVAVLNTGPLGAEYGVVTRPIFPASIGVNVLNQTVPLTNTELRSSPVAVSGTVSVGNFPAGMATEATLAAVRDRADFPLPAAQVTSLKTVTVSNAFATEATLVQVRDRANFPLPATQVTDLKTVTVANPTANPETGLAKNATLTDGTQRTQVTNFPATQTNALTNAELRASPVVTAPTDTRLLTERMMNRAPADGYSLWLDVADPAYIYVAEAPTASTGASTNFRGVRIPKDAAGNPLGKVETSGAFIWDTRSNGTWA